MLKRPKFARPTAPSILAVHLMSSCCNYRVHEVFAAVLVVGRLCWTSKHNGAVVRLGGWPYTSVMAGIPAAATGP